MRRALFTINSVIAWLAIGLDTVLTASVDIVNYFTTWSVVLVAVTTAMLARGSSATWRRLPWLRNTSLVMITVTGVVQAILLAPEEHLLGWAKVADVLEHQVTPVLTLVLWLVLGPRGWLSLRAIVSSLLIPLIWIAYTMIHGAITGVYPYDFIDPNINGYGDVAATLVEILIFGIAVGFVLWGIDRLLLRRFTNHAPAGE